MGLPAMVRARRGLGVLVVAALATWGCGEVSDDEADGACVADGATGDAPAWDLGDVEPTWTDGGEIAEPVDLASETWLDDGGDDPQGDAWNQDSSGDDALEADTAGADSPGAPLDAEPDDEPGADDGCPGCDVEDAEPDPGASDALDEGDDEGAGDAAGDMGAVDEDLGAIDGGEGDGAPDAALADDAAEDTAAGDAADDAADVAPDGPATCEEIAAAAEAWLWDNNRCEVDGDCTSAAGVDPWLEYAVGGGPPLPCELNCTLPLAKTADGDSGIEILSAWQMCGSKTCYTGNPGPVACVSGRCSFWVGCSP